MSFLQIHRGQYTGPLLPGAIGEIAKPSFFTEAGGSNRLQRISPILYRGSGAVHTLFRGFHMAEGLSLLGIQRFVPKPPLKKTDEPLLLVCGEPLKDSVVRRLATEAGELVLAAGVVE
jgi:hypothetical protein